MKKHIILMMTTLMIIASCGDGTVRVNKTTSSTTSTSSDGVVTTTSSGTMSLVTRTVTTVGSYYYSFSGYLHSECQAEATAPICAQVVVDTTVTQRTYVNNCSWQKAGSPSQLYSYSRPCTY